MGTTKFTLNRIVCEGTSEAGSDEVIILWQPDAGFASLFPPGRVAHSLSDGEDWPDIDLEMEFTNDCLVTLYDQDEHEDPKLSDYLVSYDYTPDSMPSSVTLSNRNGAKYTLEIKDVVITK